MKETDNPTRRGTAGTRRWLIWGLAVALAVALAMSLVVGFRLSAWPPLNSRYWLIPRLDVVVSAVAAAATVVVVVLNLYFLSQSQRALRLAERSLQLTARGLTDESLDREVSQLQSVGFEAHRRLLECKAAINELKHQWGPDIAEPPVNRELQVVLHAGFVTLDRLLSDALAMLSFERRFKLHAELCRVGTEAVREMHDQTLDFMLFTALEPTSLDRNFRHLLALPDAGTVEEQAEVEQDWYLEEAIRSFMFEGDQPRVWTQLHAVDCILDRVAELIAFTIRERRTESDEARTEFLSEATRR